MAIIVSGIRTALEEPETSAVDKAVKKLKLKKSDVKSAKIYKTSVDARHDICFVHSVYIELYREKNETLLSKRFPEARIIKREKKTVKYGNEKLKGKIYVAGFGPAGMFCGLTLCENGYRPVILERGADMDSRIKAVESYWKGGGLDLNSNVQFGEGGAGTFSDGKLTTRINDPLCLEVLEKLVSFGAPEDILTSAKPHIGTDKLRNVVKNLRNSIIGYGGEVRFLAPLTDISVEKGEVSFVSFGGITEPCGALVTALGHSAVDAFEMLIKRGIMLEPKAFSVGFRIEHLQEDINKALYGKYCGHPKLPPAEYQMSYRENERGVYTFCMCPGGFVVASESENGTIVTNGMSYYDRAGKNADSAVLVGVTPEDFGREPLSGVEFIRKIERKAYDMGKNGKAPFQLVSEFLGEKSSYAGRVAPTYPRGVSETNLREIFPEQISEFIAKGLKYFNGHIAGFSDMGGALTGAETRSSSPVRITRNENGTVTGADNLYPCGEGCGYAGGIMSAAVDGIKTAVKIMERFSP